MNMLHGVCHTNIDHVRCSTVSHIFAFAELWAFTPPILLPAYSHFHWSLVKINFCHRRHLFSPENSKLSGFLFSALVFACSDYNNSGFHRMPRSRSRSPREDERRRSRSPLSRPRVNERDHPRKNYGNFRWKDNRRDNFRSKARNDNSGLARGYRDRGERARSPPRGQYERGDRNREQGDGRYSQSSRHDIEKNTEGGRERKPTVKKPAAQPTEPLIVVHVNDRLGTKASIPCLPSDPISMPKASRHIRFYVNSLELTHQLICRTF